MAGHLNEEALMEAVEGAAAESARRHLEDCRSCATRVAEARVGWALAESAAIPEPSPLYWDVFRQQVDRRIRGEAAPRRHLTAWWPALVATAAGVIAAVTFINPVNPTRPRHGSEANRLVSAWTVPADGTGLDAFDLALDEAALDGDCGDFTDCLMELSDEEAQALAEILDDDQGEKR